MEESLITEIGKIALSIQEAQLKQEKVGGWGAEPRQTLAGQRQSPEKEERGPVVELGQKVR